MYLVKHKFEAFEMFKEYRNEVKKQAGKVIKILWLDWRGEYLNGEFQSYCKENNIVSHGWNSGYATQEGGELGF